MWTWYLTRGTGAAALVLLTVSVVIGALHTARWRSPRTPRFVVDDVHRVTSLLALALVAAHVVTSVLDSFAPVRVTDAFVPFAGVYRPTWLGLGAIAFDLMLVLAVTSIYRSRIGYRAWRVIHVSAWACWPPALLHALGTGSDVKRGWMLALGLGCAAAVALALGARLWNEKARYRVALRAGGAVAVAGSAVALAAWLPHGPLGHGWARRSGTPLALLIPKQAAVRLPAAPRPVAAPARRVRASAHQDRFSAEARGVVHQGADPNGTELVDIALTVSSPERRRLDVRIAGTPLGDGGVELQRSQVAFGPPRDPGRYVGQLVSLSGTRIEARLRPLRGRSIDLQAALVLDHSTGQARAHITVRPL